jgi:rod shape-determining protein MreD
LITMVGGLAESSFVRGSLVVMVAFAAQLSFVADIRPFGVVCDVLLLLSLVAGLVAGPRRGAQYGFVLGLLIDSVVQTPFGLSALTYSSGAFLVGLLPVDAVFASMWLQMAAVAVGSGAAALFFSLVGAVFGEETLVSAHLIAVVLVIGITNGLLAPLAVHAQRWALMAGDRPRL